MPGERKYPVMIHTAHKTTIQQTGEFVLLARICLDTCEKSTHECPQHRYRPYNTTVEHGGRCLQNLAATKGTSRLTGRVESAVHAAVFRPNTLSPTPRLETPTNTHNLFVAHIPLFQNTKPVASPPLPARPRSGREHSQRKDRGRAFICYIRGDSSHTPRCMSRETTFTARLLSSRRPFKQLSRKCEATAPGRTGCSADSREETISA